MSTHTSTHDLGWFSDPGTPWGGEESRIEQLEYDADTELSSAGDVPPHIYWTVIDGQLHRASREEYERWKREVARG
jgi:hypothetical protein